MSPNVEVEGADDLSNASSKLTEIKMKVLHVDDYRDYVRDRSQTSTLFNLLAIEESKVGDVMMSEASKQMTLDPSK